MTQPWAEAVSWIYFGFQTSLPPCSHLYSWEGSGPYPELDFPPSPRADTEQAMLAGDMWVLPALDIQECGQG